MNVGLTSVVVAAAALCGGFAVACGDDDSSAGGAPADGSAQKRLKVAMVTDVGGLNDRSFNESAYKGMLRAEKELGVEVRAVTSKSNADYVPNLTALARQDFDLVVAVGFMMAEATEKVANAFPETKFAIVDYSQEAMKSDPANLQGLLFAEHEAGYLVGYLAGLYVKDKGGQQIVASVGGQKIPPVDAYIAGFQAGAEAANPAVKTLNDYSQDFTDQAKCKELALNQLAQGARVVFTVAGQCGLGALDAVKAKGAQGIGVDADQGYLGDHVITSALKKVDDAVVQTVADVQRGRFKGGGDAVFDVKSNGVGYGKVNAVGKRYVDRVEAELKRIRAGQLTDIPREVE